MAGSTREGRVSHHSEDVFRASIGGTSACLFPQPSQKYASCNALPFAPILVLLDNSVERLCIIKVPHTIRVRGQAWSLDRRSG